MLYNKPMNNQVYDVIILGGGPSGLTAAIYTARANLSTLVLAGNPPGGQLMLTSEVENFPGFPQGIDGPQLIAGMRSQAEKFSAKCVNENALEILGSFTDGFTVASDTGAFYLARTVIIATGAVAKWLELPNEQRLRGRGVSACATCDGFFFKGKVIAVVGGGDAAMEEATYLTKYAEKVYVLVRSDKDAMKASKIMQAKAFANPKLEFKFHTAITNVLGENSVEGLEIQDTQTGVKSIMNDVRGLFVAIGHKPNTDFLKNDEMVALGKFGYALLKEGTYTHALAEGVFLAGDVSDWKYRQAITASGFGCMAAMDCEKFIAERSAHAKE